MKTYFEGLVGEFKNFKFKRGKRKDPLHSLILTKQKQSDAPPAIVVEAYMTQKNWDELKEIAADHGIGLKDLCKIVLEDFLMKYKKSDEFFKRAGI